MHDHAGWTKPKRWSIDRWSIPPPPPSSSIGAGASTMDEYLSTPDMMRWWVVYYCYVVLLNKNLSVCTYVSSCTLWYACILAYVRTCVCTCVCERCTFACWVYFWVHALCAVFIIYVRVRFLSLLWFVLVRSLLHAHTHLFVSKLLLRMHAPCDCVPWLPNAWSRELLLYSPPNTCQHICNYIYTSSVLNYKLF